MSSPGSSDPVKLKAYATVDSESSDPNAEVMLHMSPGMLSIIADELRRAYQAGLDGGRHMALREIAYLSRRGMIQFVGGGRGVAGTVDVDAAGSSGTRAADVDAAGSSGTRAADATGAGASAGHGYQVALRERRARRRLQALSRCGPY